MFAPLLALSLAVSQPVQTADDYAATWDKVKQLISRTYFDRVNKKAEMESRLKEAGEKAKAARNRKEFSSIVLEMIDSFKASHFDFLTQEDQGYYAMDNIIGGKSEMPQIGAWFRRGKDGYTVQMVLTGSEAEKQGIWKGDQIISADGKTFEPIRSFEKKESVILTLRRNGQTVTKTVHPAMSTGIGMFLDATKNSGRIIEQGGKKFGYFHLWMMINDDFRNATNAAISRYMNTDAFILDIRDGFGGRPERFLDTFFLPSSKIEWNFGSASQTQTFGYGKPLILLINEGSRSAKEVAAFLIKASKRGILVGKTTAGHVLGTSPVRVNAWSMLEVPSVTLKVDGVDLEGKGVSPDIEVNPEFGTDGSDLILQKGIEIALREASK